MHGEMRPMEKLKKEYEFPIYLFNKGENYRAYEFFGAHKIKEDCFAFRVWAPDAVEVSVVGDFNDWSENSNKMKLISPGIWEAVIDGVKNMIATNTQFPQKTAECFTKQIPMVFTAKQGRERHQKFMSWAAINGTTSLGKNLRQRAAYLKSP